MRFVHTLFFLLGVQLMINGAFFSSPLLTALGAGIICLFILLATQRRHQYGSDIGPTYHHMGTTNNKETYFAPLALVALIGGMLAYLFLPMSDIYAKTAVVLAGTGLIYLLLASFAHGGHVTIKNIFGILFSGLLLLGIGGIVALWRKPIVISASSAYTYLQQTFITKESEAASLSGDIIAYSGDDQGKESEALSLSGKTETTGMMSSGSAPTLTTKQTTTAPNTHTLLTYNDFIPYIVYKHNLSASTKPDIAFTYISKKDKNYYAFKAAYYNRFFGKTINPDRLVSCDKYAIFVGLADNRPLQYTAANVYTVFRNEAKKKGVLNGCVQGAYVNWGNLN